MEPNPYEQIVDDHDLLCPHCKVPPLLKTAHGVWVVQCLSCGRTTKHTARYVAEADGWINVAPKRRQK